MNVTAICGCYAFVCVTVKEARVWAKKVMEMEQESCTLYRINKDGSFKELYENIPYRRD